MKLVLLTVVCLAVLCVVQGATSYSEAEYQNAFLDWQRTHNKAFSSDEFLTRFANFKNMFDFIRDHNSKNLSWTVGLNEFSHMSSAEFKRVFLTVITPDRTRNVDAEFTGEGHVSRAATVDWRARGKVTAVKNQGQCGSCWTFAATATIESAWAIKTGKLPTLSEQQLLDCTSSTQSCSGGNPTSAMNYVKTAGGHDTMASYPYQTAKYACRYNAANSAATVSGATYVSATESALATALNTQPISVCIDAGRASFQSYKSGIYSDTTCTTTLNHAVTAVGYGNDGAGDYWIIKNSWGTGWGNLGYFQLQKGVNRCGVANAASFPTTTGTGNRV